MSMATQTARWALPLLAAGQAQKEITHNEALLLIDLLLNPRVQSATLSVPPASPAEGAAWIVAAGATGDWTGRTLQIAQWTEGGWRFAAPVPGMRVWDEASGTFMLYRGGVWSAPPTLADVTGGSVIDSQARAALGALLAILRQHGILKT